jgi:hypothetical protein
MRPVLIDPNKTIESINARQTSVGQSEQHRERVILSWLPTEDLTRSAPNLAQPGLGPTLPKQKGRPEGCPHGWTAFGD